MSKMKEFLEEVSVEMGCGGEINQLVLVHAQNKMAQLVSRLERKKLDEPFDGTFKNRTDGRVELTCSCGIGHPSRLLTELRKGYCSSIELIHGCCGHCSDKSFSEWEELIAETVEKPED